ncbi:MAG: hypothetical protein NC548_28785 [Lachnospiraceae bacterium]|nr:hypothetical protein [Lachnospiraceae bacterium]
MSTNNNTYGNGLVDGLKPAMDIPQIGAIFKDTLANIAKKLRAELAGSFKLTECDNVIILPRLAKNSVGATEIGVTAFFVPTPGGNIYFRGKGKNNSGNGGRVNMIQSAGAAAGGTGPFGTSAEFEQVIKPLCKTNDKGEPIMTIKQQRGGVASVELDFNAVMCLVLGIKPNDSYDFSVISIMPIADNNFMIVVAKMIVGRQNKGSKSNIDYAQLEREMMRRFNNGGGNNNGGGRQF